MQKLKEYREFLENLPVAFHADPSYTRTKNGNLSGLNVSVQINLLSDKQVLDLIARTKDLTNDKYPVRLEMILQ